MSLTTKLELEDYLEVMCIVVPALLDKCGVTMVRLNLLLILWPVERVQNILQHKGSEDCGVFVYKFFEYVVTWSDMSTHTQANMPFFK